MIPATGDDRRWGAATAVLGAAASASFAAWLLLWLDAAAGPLALLSAAAAVAGASAGRRALRLDDGPLLWDGDRWSHRAVAGRLQPLIDLGDWILLRFEPAAGGRAAWLALSSADAGARWHGWRTAVYSRRPDEPPPSDPAPRKDVTHV